MSKSPTLRSRSPRARRSIPTEKQHLSKTEKTYREMMGPDGKVRQQFQYILLELEIDSEDLLDK